jgi:hypothetical protein
MSIAASEIADDLHWSDYQKGFILSSFFWGYSVGQIPATLIAQRYGHKYTFGFAVLFSSFVSLFLPTACHISFSSALCIRALTGLMSSALFPSSYHFFPRWIPLSEKTLMISIFGSGMYMGEIIGFSVSGFLVSTNSSFRFNDFQIGGWPSAFYFFGLIGLFWSPFYFWNVYGSPDDHPTITLEEKHFILKGLQQNLRILKEEENIYEFYVAAAAAADEENENGEHETESLLDHQEKDHQEEKENGGTMTRTTRKSKGNQSDLRKRISSIGGAIVSESLEVSSRFEQNSLPPSGGGGGLPSSLSSSSLATQQQQLLLQQQSPLLSHDQLHTLAPPQGLNSPSSSSHKAMNDLTFSDIPWLAFATTPQALILFLCHWCYSFVGFILLTEIPAFLTEELNYDIESAGLLSIAPYAANFISTILFAMYFDRVEVCSSSAESLPTPTPPSSLIGVSGN